MNIRSHLNPGPGFIRLQGNDLYLDGPAGLVRLRREGFGIEAEYRGDRLRNGTARRYAEQLRDIAIKLALEHASPWTSDEDGWQHIRDPRRFYNETFDPTLLGIETLKRWLIETGLPSTGEPEHRLVRRSS